MLLATVVLSAAALASAAATSAAADPQDPPATAPEAAPMAVPEEPVPPAGGFEVGDVPTDPAPVTAPEAAPMAVPEEPVPPAGGFEVGDVPTDPAPVAAPTEAAPPLGLEASELPAGPSPAFQEHIDAGLKAFIRGRFSRARGEFEKAYAADPQSAAAAFYLGYACYKVGEPSARMNENKQKARDLFAQAYQLDPAFQPVWGQKRE